MTTATATVRNGRLELSEPLGLPDGTELSIPLPGDEKPDREETPEEIAAALKLMDEMVPIELTDEEWAAWDARRRADRDRELARFFDESLQLREVWK